MHADIPWLANYKTSRAPSGQAESPVEDNGHPPFIAGCEAGLADGPCDTQAPQQPVSAADELPALWVSQETLDAMALHRSNAFPAGGMGLACRAGNATIPLYVGRGTAQAPRDELKATSGQLLDLDVLLAAYHAAVWRACESGDTDYDLAGVEEAKAVQRQLRAMLTAQSPHPRPTDDALWDQTIRERDEYHDIADELADAIAQHLNVDIGEHSSANSPWVRALESIKNAPAPQTSAHTVAELARDPFLVARAWRQKPGQAAFEAAVPLELVGVTETLNEGGGSWRSCSGCHELNEGHDTGPYSATMKCHLGSGCSLCGGIGAVWDTTDYQAMADDMARAMGQSVAVPAAPAVPSLPVATTSVRRDFGDCYQAGPPPGQLPMLPDPITRARKQLPNGSYVVFDAFNADQMRAYAEWAIWFWNPAPAAPSPQGNRHA